MNEKGPIVTNLQILAPSRKAPKVRDIFVCRPVGCGYFFAKSMVQRIKGGQVRKRALGGRPRIEAMVSATQ